VLSSVKSCYGLRHEVCVENGVESPKTTKSLLEVRSEVDGYRITKNTKVFLNIGRLCDQKNQVMLLEAFNRLIDNDRDVVLLVIGNDETESNEYLRKLKAMSNNERVHLLGLKSNVSDYLSCADVFCLSSLYEGLPITLLEAMAMKIIILSTPVGGIPDVIENNISGLLSAEVSLDSFYEKIEYCLSLGEAEVEDIILESKKLFKEKYAINITSERYLAEYKRLTNS
jgi:glycosyltransferase involved in cell wall biosynthesis